METTMIRGTTPKLTFKLPFSVDTLSAAYITFMQGGNEVTEKNLTDCEINGDELSLKLSQDDTLSLSENVLLEMQIKAKDQSGNVMVSQVLRVSVGEVFNEEVM